MVLKLEGVPHDKLESYDYFCKALVTLDQNTYHIIKIVSYGVDRPVGQVGQWAMAHLKGLGPHMNASYWLF